MVGGWGFHIKHLATTEEYGKVTDLSSLTAFLLNFVWKCKAAHMVLRFQVSHAAWWDEFVFSL